MSDQQPISVFEMLKIGVGPSSSHTLGPWRAAETFVDSIESSGLTDRVTSIRVELFGSLAKTGRGHGTGIAVMMGLSGHDPVTCDVDLVQRLGPDVIESGRLRLGGTHDVPFVRDRDIVFDTAHVMPEHPNALRFMARVEGGPPVVQTSYSIGGGFVAHEGDAEMNRDDTDQSNQVPSVNPPHPIEVAADLLRHCDDGDRSIAEVVRTNERTWRTESEIDEQLLAIRDVMVACVFRGCSTRGTLPGGLGVSRRAADIHDSLLGPADLYGSAEEWFDAVADGTADFDRTVKWISCFALAVNEENAAFGRVVTAPTNGAAGVLPAVMLHHLVGLRSNGASQDELDDESVRFLLIAAEVGAIFKQGATISAAMGGCQAEIGVSSAMAAAALTECRGGRVREALMAAEIAMEHHLGLTCDPIGGLVQVPCIERNVMGAVKAISAAHLALSSVPELARVSLDDVIVTMWATALDVNAKYKETAEGGLATRIPVNVVEC